MRWSDCADAGLRFCCMQILEDRCSPIKWESIFLLALCRWAWELHVTSYRVLSFVYFKLLSDSVSKGPKFGQLEDTENSRTRAKKKTVVNTRRKNTFETVAVLKLDIHTVNVALMKALYDFLKTKLRFRLPKRWYTRYIWPAHKSVPEQANYNSSQIPKSRFHALVHSDCNSGIGK